MDKRTAILLINFMGIVMYLIVLIATILACLHDKKTGIDSSVFGRIPTTVLCISIVALLHALGILPLILL